MKTRGLTHIICILALALLTVSGYAQHIYQGGSKYGTKLATWDGKHIYQGGTIYGTKLYTWDGTYLYQGGSKYGTKIFTFDCTVPIPIIYFIVGG